MFRSQKIFPSHFPGHLTIRLARVYPQIKSNEYLVYLLEEFSGGG